MDQTQIIAVQLDAENGVADPAVCRCHRISAASLYKWRAKAGGRRLHEGQMKAIDEVNVALKRMSAVLSMQAYLIQSGS